jgi:CubicO group peptidase (beta-lactamase class C family)
VKRFIACIVVVLLTLAGGIAPAQTPSSFSSERLQRIDRVLQQYVDENQLAGAVALVLRDGQPVYERAFGWSDKEASRRMTADTIFRIASQTKAITSAAILALVEEGKIGINEPVSRHIPAYAHTTVAVRNEAEMAFVPARRPITIRDLLTHTAGISYGTGRDVAALYEAKGLGPAAGFGWFTADSAHHQPGDAAPRHQPLVRRFAAERRPMGLRVSVLCGGPAGSLETTRKPEAPEFAIDLSTLNSELRIPNSSPSHPSRCGVRHGFQPLL